MLNFEIETPEPRNEPLNVRVTETTKKFVEDLAEKETERAGRTVSESLIVSQILDQYRVVTSDSNKGKPRRGN